MLIKTNLCWYRQIYVDKDKDKGDFLPWSSNNASKEVWVSGRGREGINPVYKHIWKENLKIPKKIWKENLEIPKKIWKDQRTSTSKLKSHPDGHFRSNPDILRQTQYFYTFPF